jgi:hypothetical protein
MSTPFTPNVAGFETQVVEYPNRLPEQQIVYDADAGDDFKHWTTEDAALGVADEVSDRAVKVAQDYLSVGESDDSEGGHAD